MDDGKLDDAPHTLVVLGMDESNKPRASRFTPEHATQAVVAAAMMKLHSVNVADAELQKVAAELPEGKIFATGRGFVPFVRRELFDKLAGLIGTAAEIKPEPGSLPTRESDDDKGPSTDTDPWQALRIGTTVLAKSPEAEEGWYEAVISQIAADGKELTLRWRDFPGERVFKAARRAVAILA